jgi:hypothetical protein
MMCSSVKPLTKIRQHRVMLVIFATITINAQVMGFWPHVNIKRYEHRHRSTHRAQFPWISLSSRPCIKSQQQSILRLHEQTSASSIYKETVEDSTFASVLESSSCDETLRDLLQNNATYEAVAFEAHSFSTSTRRSFKTMSDLYLSDLQANTLRAKIPRFTVPVPIRIAAPADGNNTSLNTGKFIVLWRSLVDDAPELIGYPISFLAEQAQSMDVPSTFSTTGASINALLDSNEIYKRVDWETVLPYIDAYTFETGGGLTGLVYGVHGVADGTRIRTTPVGDVQTTLPRNYVQTADGCLYELGRPSVEDESNLQSKQWASHESYSLDGASSLVTKSSSDNENAFLASSDTNLLQLSGLTLIVLGGIYALENLSHHLTINIFWV